MTLDRFGYLMHLFQSMDHFLVKDASRRDFRHHWEIHLQIQNGWGCQNCTKHIANFQNEHERLISFWLDFFHLVPAVSFFGGCFLPQPEVSGDKKTLTLPKNHPQKNDQRNLQVSQFKTWNKPLKHIAQSSTPKFSTKDKSRPLFG